MSDEDLIRRGDVVKAATEYLWETKVDPMLLWYVEQAVLTIPAADPLADPRVQALVGYSQAKRDLCLFLDPDLASADAWGWDDDSVFAAALARLTTSKPDQIDTVASSTLAEIEGEKT
jgi:hypothetical protein